MSVPRRHEIRLLWLLLALFVARVAGQLLVAAGAGDFLPPWEEWFSGAVPYPQLLASQILLILLGAKICTDFTRRRGFFVTRRPWLGTLLTAVGSVYLAGMIVRYIIRMGLYPPERWTGGAIPIFFHCVLAFFILVVAGYQRRRDPGAERVRPTARGRVMQSAAWAGLAAALSGWLAYQLAPTILANMLSARRAENAVRIERGVATTMRDGVTLISDVYHPVRGRDTPTILVRIPFSRTTANSLFATVVGRFWAERGYRVVIQGTRGRYDSEGRYYPLRHEREDGLDTLAWLQRQSWFDGRLAMWGGSAFGYTQWAIADHLPAPPAGRSAMMVQISSTDFFGMFYPGGAFSLSSALFWAVRSRGVKDTWPDSQMLERGFSGVPLVEADDRAVGPIDFFDDWVTHSSRDAYWQAIDGENRPATLQAPAMLMAGWFDPFLPGQIADFVAIRRHAPAHVAAATRLIVGPWAHAETVTLPGGVRTRSFRLESLAPSVPWFDQCLRSSPSTPMPTAPVRLFVMGANVWRDEQEWPLARARETSWYLRSAGRANTAAGDGRLTLMAPAADEMPDRYTADPLNPVPTRGGAVLGYGAGVLVQEDVEARDDVLVYTSEPLAEDLEVTGPITAILYVTTSAPSADFTAKLVDVHTEGAPYNVSDGILRLTAVRVGSAPTRIDIALWPTSMVFRQGHRIRLEVASSNFPRYDRNLQTEGDPATNVVAAVAEQAVYHSRWAPSRIVLPVVPPQR